MMVDNFIYSDWCSVHIFSKTSRVLDCRLASGDLGEIFRSVIESFNSRRNSSGPGSPQCSSIVGSHTRSQFTGGIRLSDGATAADFRW